MKSADVVEKEVEKSQPDDAFTPIRVFEIELGQPLPPTIAAVNEQTGARYQSARCLIRLHGQPMGLLFIPLGSDGSPVQEYAKQIWQELGERINAHLRADELPLVDTLGPDGLPLSEPARCQQEMTKFLQTAPFVSVVLCTRDRPDRLARCLPPLLAQHYPSYELIVVDNAPSSSATADFIEKTYAGDAHVRYVREDTPGLSAARNRGVAEAKAGIIAFTDDDVIVDADWLAGLARGFTLADNVGCVTNLLLPLELETQSQCWFEEFGGFDKGLERRIFDRKSGRKQSPLYPFTAGGFGTGAGMAFTSTFLQQERGFDQALGAGSLTGGGEDLVAFLRVLLRGYRIVYEPASLAYHEHRRDYKSLQKQVFYYGAGLTAYLTKIIVDNPLLLFAILWRIPAGFLFIGSAKSSKNAKKSTSFPSELTALERQGMLKGPMLYLRGRFKKRK